MTKLNPNEINQGSLEEIASKIRGSLTTKENLRFILLYAYNGVGKTRLSRKFKSMSSSFDEDGNRVDDTLYFNSYTEDLFQWDNEKLLLRINYNSDFFALLESHDDIGIRIRDFFKNYTRAYFEFRMRDSINPADSWTVEFLDTPDADNSKRIKISRGEERIFIWCFFLAVMQYVLDEEQDVRNSEEQEDDEGRKYSWVKYIYIDDPISSLDDNNAILVATDLADMIKDHYTKMKNRDDEKKNDSKIKIILSTHHGLFYNVIANELEGFKGNTAESYFVGRSDYDSYSLLSPKKVPFFYHLSILKDLENAHTSGNIYYYHFSMLRVVLEKISSFFGYDAVSECIPNEERRSLYNRVVNLRSHGKHSLYEVSEVDEAEKRVFRAIYEDIRNKYKFSLK